MNVLGLLTQIALIIGIIQPGETLSTQDTTAILASVNALLDSWNAAIAKSIAGQYSNLVAQWNAAIKRALGMTFDSLIDSWNAITQKSLAEALPPSLYTFNALSTATALYTFNPLSTGTALVTFVPVADLVNLTDTLVLPGGWIRAVSYNAALDLAPFYGRNISPEIQTSAAESRAAILTPPNTVPAFSLSIDQLLSNVAAIAQNPETAPVGHPVPLQQMPQTQYGGPQQQLQSRR